MPTSLRGSSYYSYFSEKHSHSSSIAQDPRGINVDYIDNNKQYHSLKIYLLLMLKVIIIALFLKFVSRGIFIILLAWNTNYYYEYHLWIGSILIATLIPQSILSFYLIITIYGQKRHRRKIIIIQILVSVGLIIFEIWLGIKWHNYHSLPPIISYFFKPKMEIIYANAFEASMYIYYLPLNMALSIILLFIINYYKEIKPKNYIELDIVSSESNHNYRALNIPLTGTTMDFGYYQLTEINEINHDSNPYFYKHILLWTLLIIFVFIMFYIQYCFHDINPYFTESVKGYEYIIRCWILWMIVAKFVLKYIGHQFDETRININPNLEDIDNNNNDNCDVSLEVILEIWLSLSYWIIFRYYLVVFPNPDLSAYFLAKITHILSELFTCLRMSKFYYDYSLNFIFWLKQKSWYHYIPIFYIGDDECKYIEWLNRCSMDIGIRFIIAITTSLYMFEGLTILFWFHETFGYSKNQYIHATYYSLISTLIEFIFYFLLFIWYKCRYNINIFEACNILYYKCGRRRIYAITFFAILTSYSYV